MGNIGFAFQASKTAKQNTEMELAKERDRGKAFRSFGKVFFFGALLFLGRGAVGQICQNIPVDPNDGLAKSPQNFKLLYETEDVRVLEATIPPHGAQAMHSFTRPAILYLRNSVRSKTFSPDITDPLEHEEEKPFQPKVIRISPSGPYSTQNLSRHMFVGLRVELKHPGCGIASDSSELKSSSSLVGTDPAHTNRILYEDADVRVTDVRITSGEHSLPANLPGFYYFPKLKARQEQMSDDSGVSKGDRIVPFASLDKAIGSGTPSGKPLHAIRFELKYKVQNSGQGSLSP
ncbi:hypothetical protein [Granulicella sp. dw_53]|uniref:hypothetical protein n=1 Tax=Granulicella sp. dw_53 TaxID=2719792 RepID=UPI001BD5EE26|nr:hypothetical protein [Granulicella sp. dw_53]